jgi:hypothetical protein
MKSLLDLGYDVPVSKTLAGELRSIMWEAGPSTRDGKQKMWDLLASRGLLSEETADGLRKWVDHKIQRWYLMFRARLVQSFIYLVVRR